LVPAERLEVATLVANRNLTVEEASKSYGLSFSAIRKYVRQLSEQGPESFPVEDKRKTAQRPENSFIDEALLRFCKQARAKNLPLTHAVVREKALQYAKVSKDEAFTASGGFLQKFFARHHLASVVQHGEAGSVNHAEIPQVLQFHTSHACRTCYTGPRL
jgi:transposase-like protein